MDKCKICQLDRELTTCDNCMNEMQVSMFHKLMKEDPNIEMLRKDINHLLEEIRDIKDCLNKVGIEGIKLKRRPKNWEEAFDG